MLKNIICSNKENISNSIIVLGFKRTTTPMNPVTLKVNGEKLG